MVGLPALALIVGAVQAHNYRFAMDPAGISNLTQQLPGAKSIGWQRGSGSTDMVMLMAAEPGVLWRLYLHSPAP